MRTAAPIAPPSYGIAGDAKKFPCPSAANAPSVKSVAAMPGELTGPRRTIVTDSPGVHPVPVIVRALFQVKSNGWVTPLIGMPPDTLIVAGDPSKAHKNTAGRRIAMILRFMGVV